MNNIGYKLCLSLLIFYLTSAYSFSKSITNAQVLKVIDGDTIECKEEGKEETIKIRLDGIDAPEEKQEYGNESSVFLRKLLLYKKINITYSKKDNYDRILGNIILDSTNVNLYSVQTGNSWWYKKYAPKRLDLKKAQENAQLSKLGLWAYDSPVPPWEHRDSIKNTSDEVKPIPIPESHYQQQYFQDNLTNNTKTFLNYNDIIFITTTGKRFHNSSCRFLEKSKHSITVKEALELGYSAGQCCFPNGVNYPDVKKVLDVTGKTFSPNNQKELEMKTIDRHQKDFAREFDGANNQMKMYLDELDRQREVEEKSRKLGR